MSQAHRRQKKASDPWELELTNRGCQLPSGRNSTQVLSKNCQCSNHSAISPASTTDILNKKGELTELRFGMKKNFLDSNAKSDITLGKQKQRLKGKCVLWSWASHPEDRPTSVLLKCFVLTITDVNS